MTVALEWIITVHSFSVELFGHDSGIILYMINGSRAHLSIQFSLFSLYSNQYTHLYRFASASIRLSPPTLSLPVSPHRLSEQ